MVARPLFPSNAAAHLKTFIGKVIANEFDDIAIVLDNQDALHIQLSG